MQIYLYFSSDIDRVLAVVVVDIVYIDFGRFVVEERSATDTPPRLRDDTLRNCNHARGRDRRDLQNGDKQVLGTSKDTVVDVTLLQGFFDASVFFFFLNQQFCVVATSS
jgi:hypothetical protein